MNEEDLDNFVVVRVADEIVVDLMLAACGVTYAEAESEIEYLEVAGVRIPFASKKLLWPQARVARRDQLDRH